MDAPLALGELGPVDFPTLGWQVIDWIEAYLCHGPGDVQGAPMRIDDEYALFVCHAYRLRDDGRRATRRAFLSRPKGRAKSELAAALSCAEALGPVRFDGWDARGDPVGRPVVAPSVLNFATAEGQAGNTYEAVRYMLLTGEVFRQYHLREQQVGVTGTTLPGGGTITPETAADSSKDGGKETFVVFDETHLWTLPRLHRLHSTVRRNLGKRKAAQPWALETSTMYAPGQGSVAELTHAQARKDAETGRWSGVLFDHREAPWVEDLSDDAEVLAALTYVYGPAAEWMDLESIMDEMRDAQTDPADARRYFFNQVERLADSLIDVRDWRALGDAEELAPGSFITLGFDGGRFDDSTALVACRIEDGKLFHVATWERPDNAPEGWAAPASEVDAEVHRMMTTHDVWRLYGDPPYWQDEMAAWAQEWPETVHEWWTNRERAMTTAMERVLTAVRGGTMRHDGNLTLERHVGNCRRKVVRSGVLPRKEAPKSPKKIDAAVAAILAYEARADAVAAGAKPRVKRARRHYGF